MTTDITDRKDQMPTPSPHHAPDAKVFPAFAFDTGVLQVRRQGYGDANGSGHFAFNEENLDWDYDEGGRPYVSVPVARDDLLFIRDHLNELFPPDTIDALRREREEVLEGLTVIAGRPHDMGCPALDQAVGACNCHVSIAAALLARLTAEPGQ